ncbi:hypothetical protein ACFL1M_02595 [Patescibacteria group bacterium]
MKRLEFDKEIDKRLKENRVLFNNPGPGMRLGRLGTFLGLNSFWIIFFASFVLAKMLLRNDYIEGMNSMLFGFLYE